MFKSFKFWAVGLLLLVASSSTPGVLATSSAANRDGPTLYVVTPVDTEDYDWVYYPLENMQRSGNPLFDTSQFKRRLPNGEPTDMATIMTREFRNSHRDSFGGSIKMSWFAMVDQHYDRSTYKDESPDYPQLTGKPVGYTGLLETLQRYWGRQIQQHGDGVYWHHHVMSWTGSAWVDNSSVPKPYTHHYDALNRLILDQQYFPSIYRAGWCWEDGEYSKFLTQWIPFDFSAIPTNENVGTPSDWKPYHPNVDNPWASNAPNQERWMVRAAGQVVENDPHLHAAFQLAQAEGKAIYSRFLHNRDGMAYDVDWLHNALVDFSKNKYPGVKFKYVTAQEAMQQYLGLRDKTDPRLNIRKADAISYSVSSNEHIWNNKPYVTAKYVGGSEEFYEQVVAASQAERKWAAKIPTLKLLAPPDEVAPEYHPVAFEAGSSFTPSGPHLNPLFYGPERAHDGSDNTFWDSWDLRDPNNPGEGPWLPAWIKMDLGEVQTIYMITLRWLHDWERKYSYYIEASVDGSNWTRIGEAEMATDLVTHDLSPDDASAGVQVRYIRVTVTGSSEKSAHLCEVSFFGEPYPENEPEEPKRLVLNRVGVAANDLFGNAQVETIQIKKVAPKPRASKRDLQADYKGDVPKEWEVGEKEKYQVTVINKGKETWRKGGGDAVRLSVQFGNQSDRPGDGWEREQRFDLPKDVAPGESVAITVEVTAPDRANRNYVLRHRMVKSGNVWFDQIKRNSVKVMPPNFAGELKPDPPKEWLVGQSRGFEVTVRNKGNEVLNSSDTIGIVFGPEAEQWHKLGTDVAPGKSASVKIEGVTAPSEPGEYTMRFRLMKEGLELEKPKVEKVKVVPIIYQAELKADLPKEWLANQEQSYSVKVTNKGNDPWTATSDVRLRVRLAAEKEAAAGKWLIDQTIKVEQPVEPDKSLRLTVKLTAPEAAGKYLLLHQMGRGESNWFGKEEKDSINVRTK